MLKCRTLLILLIAGLGCWQTGSGAWIYAKARLAQVLLEKAWEKNLAGNTQARPWPWADTWPVARLRIPSRDVDVIVLQGDSGRSLAFAPGMAAGSAPPGQPGTTLISAHRDTHFKNIADIQPGEQIELETTHGSWTYRVLYTDVVDARHTGISSDPLHDELVLVTCYPFEALVHGGPFRLVIRTEPVSRNTGLANQHNQTTAPSSSALASRYRGV
ncbi:MAG: class GN sortase [Pseudomonadota bacterium]|nr:class GN sortase [Pseudomonadota bacterium]